MVGQGRQEYTYAEYLRLEAEHPQTKHEFLDGMVWAKAGGTPDHAALAMSIGAMLSEQLRGKPCRVYGSDLRLRVLATGLATYPDVAVICDKQEADPDDPAGNTLVNPKVLVEVLSPSTEKYDRGEKLAHYKTIPSLEHVVLVAHDASRLEVWTREGGRWSVDLVKEGEVAMLPAIGCSLPVSEVYRNPLEG